MTADICSSYISWPPFV